MMKRAISILCGAALLAAPLAAAVAAKAGYTFFNPTGSFAIEVSLDNPPYNLIRLPIYRNAITSLAVVGDSIVGGTSARSGLAPFVFVASLSQRKMLQAVDLNDIIPGQRSIRTGFCRGQSSNVLYAGTIANDPGKSSGHLLKVTVLDNGHVRVDDLGKTQSGEGVYALTCSRDGATLYGITYPSGYFFTYDVGSKRTHTYKSTAPTEEQKSIYHRFVMHPREYLSADLIVDNQGRVYGSEPINKIFYFDPDTNSMHILDASVPFVWGRHALGRIDAWAKAKNGMLYGSNGGDGQLFRLNPKTGHVVNLGKPIMMNRMPALAFGANGVLYGIAGASPGYAHLFTYDTNHGFFDLGNPQFEMVAPGIEQGISWRGFQIDTLVASPDGKYIVMGENESLSQLLVFPVKAE